MSGAWYRGKKVEETDFADGSFDGSGQKFAPKGGASTASELPIVDVGGYYASNDVEGALQEAGADIVALSTVRQHDWVGSTSYEGWAAGGTSEATTGWHLTKIVVASAGTVTVTHATNSWTNHLTASYS